VKLPFNPIDRGLEVERIVMLNGSRRYSRFRFANFYGGICTADAVGCNFLCAYCWNYYKNENPLNVGSLFTPAQVVQKLKSMADKNDCDKFRISGCEPFISKASTVHIKNILDLMDNGDFIIESNGLLLGFDPSLIDLLAGFDNILIRIAVKADNDKTFEALTGSLGSYREYQLKAIHALRANGINVSVAYMPNFVDPELLGLGSDEEFDIEGLKYYKGTSKRLSDRGLLGKPEKPKKPILEPFKPKAKVGYVPFWQDKGDIT
jgi:uncharacterized Fe-S cluster-containing radical SAM superfamily protein